VLDVLGDSATPSLEELRELKYTNDFIKETLRCSVLAPFAARVSERPTRLTSGADIPPNTPIIHALGVVMHNPRFFAHPAKFNPDRRESTVLAFSPFGFAGGRVCPGKMFANVEAAATIATLLRRFRLVLTAPDAEVVKVHGIVTSPKEEIMIRLETL